MARSIDVVTLCCAFKLLKYERMVFVWCVCAMWCVFVTLLVAGKAKINGQTNSLVVYRVLFRLVASCS